MTGIDILHCILKAAIRTLSLLQSLCWLDALLDEVHHLAKVYELDANNEVIGYEFVHLGKMMDFIKKGIEPAEALEKAKGSYGRFKDAVKYIDPRHE